MLQILILFQWQDFCGWYFFEPNGPTASIMGLGFWHFLSATKFGSDLGDFCLYQVSGFDFGDITRSSIGNFWTFFYSIGLNPENWLPFPANPFTFTVHLNIWKFSELTPPSSNSIWLAKTRAVYSIIPPKFILLGCDKRKRLFSHPYLCTCKYSRVLISFYSHEFTCHIGLT